MKFSYFFKWSKSINIDHERIMFNFEGPHEEDHIIHFMNTKGNFYEHDLLEYLALINPKSNLIIDVGANIGNHTIYFSKFLANQVLAIEPSKKIFNILNKNLQTNNIKNCVTYNCAVGCETGIVKLASPINPRKSGMAHILSINESSNKDLEINTTEIKPLDTIIQDLEQKQNKSLPVQLIKIDVEGTEINVLKGAKYILEQYTPQLVIEASSKEQKKEIDEFLKEFGYEAIACFCTTPTYFYINKKIHKLKILPFSYKIYLTRNKIGIFIRKVFRFMLNKTKH